MKRIRDKKKVFITVLISIILVLLLFGTYLFWVKPSLNGLVVLGRNQGYNLGVFDSVLSLMQQASTCQPVPITLGNQTIDMIAVGCLPAECLQ